MASLLRLDEMAGWHRIVFRGGSFPSKAIKDKDKKIVKQAYIPNHEARIWPLLAESRTDMGTELSLGDYLTESPDFIFSTNVGGGGRAHMAVRWMGPDGLGWHWQNLGIKGRPSERMRDVAAALQETLGAEELDGSLTVAQLQRMASGHFCGNSSQWRQLGIQRHIDIVLSKVLGHGNAGLIGVSTTESIPDTYPLFGSDQP